MIIKSYELNKIDLKKNNFFLFYGKNEGHQNEIIKQYFTDKFEGQIQNFNIGELKLNEILESYNFDIHSITFNKYTGSEEFWGLTIPRFISTSIENNISYVACNCSNFSSFRN